MGKPNGRKARLLRQLFTVDKEKTRRVSERAAQRRRIVSIAWDGRSSLADGLRRVREAVGLSPQVVSEQAQLSLEEYRRLELGEGYPWDVSADTFVRLLSVLGLPVAWVIPDLTGYELSIPPTSLGFVARSYGRMRRAERRRQQEADEVEIRRSILERRRTQFIRALRSFC